MKIAKFVLISTLATLSIASANAATMFNATIDASQIVGGSKSTGTGTATATLVGGPGNYSFQYSAEFTGFDFGALMVPYVRDGLLLDNLSPSASATATTPETGDDVQNFHIHLGATGFTGGVVYSVRQPDRENGTDPVIELLANGNARITGSWDLADGNPLTPGTNTGVGSLESFWAPVMLAAQPGQAIGLYFDIHTNDFPGSAIRGQITAVPEPGSIALMFAGLGALAAVARRRKV
jgi:hypothetical protein